MDTLYVIPADCPDEDICLLISWGDLGAVKQNIFEAISVRKNVRMEGASFHIVSLLDMLRVYAAHFIQVSALLADLRGIIKTLYFSGKTAAKFNPEMLNEYLTKMDWLLSMLSGMQLKMSLITAEKIKKHIEESQRPDKELSGLISVLNGRIFDELNTRLFFIISPEEARLYNPEGTIYGKEIADKFPNMVEDIVEAGNCFACNRYTACVFHLMRIMERGVQELGNKFGVLPIFTYNEDWQKIVNAIRGQLNIIYPKHNDSMMVSFYRP
jgi:hypothetical protein